MTRRAKYPIEKKIRAAERYIKGEASAARIAAELGMTRTGDKTNSGMGNDLSRERNRRISRKRRERKAHIREKEASSRGILAGTRIIARNKPKIPHFEQYDTQAMDQGV